MFKVLKGLAMEEDGISTVEIVVIISILIGIALLFRKSITAYVTKVIGNFIDTAPNVNDIEELAPTPKS